MKTHIFGAVADCACSSANMFLRSQVRKKDGQEHTYWSEVENKRLHDGRVVQRQTLYLGAVNDSP